MLKRKVSLESFPWKLFCFLLIVYGLYAVLNWLTPLWCDDLDYGDAGHSLSAIFNREKEEYLHHCGRVFSHSLVQLFAGILGKPLFNLLNPLLTLLLVVMVVKTAGISLCKECEIESLFALSVSLVLVWFILPDQYITMFMIAGSSNYIWATVFNLTYVYLFTNRLSGSASLNGWKNVGICILSFIVGAWMELYSIALAPALFFYLLLNKDSRNRKTLLSFAFYVLGTIQVVFAPGNFERHTPGDSVQISTWIINQLENAIRFKLIWVWIVTLLILVVQIVKRKNSVIAFVRETMIWQIGIVVSYAFLFVSGVSSYRSSWGIFVFSFVILFCVLRKTHLNKIICVIASVLMILMVLSDFVKEFGAFKAKNNAVTEMLVQAESNSLTENQYYLWPQTVSTKKSMSVPSGVNGVWPCEFVSRYYHVGKISVLPKDVYPYCSGREAADSLFFGTTPAVHGWTVIERPSDWTVSVSYLIPDDEKTFYVFHGKVERLLRAMGLNELAGKAFPSKDAFLLGKFLLEKYPSDKLEMAFSPDSEGLSAFEYDGKRYMAIPLGWLTPKYDFTASTCIVE